MSRTPTTLTLAALVATAVVLVPSVSPTQPEAADRQGGGEVWIPRGVYESLGDGPPSERVRVKLLAHRQPLLRASARPAFRRALERPIPARVRAAARTSPERITPPEKRFARRAQRERAKAISGLRRPARRAIRLASPLRRAVRSVGGRVIGSSPLVAGVTARLPRAALEQLAARPDVQAILPEPRERPQLDIAAQVIGADVAWAAGHNGGTGSSDELSTVAAVLNEAPDPDHPAFSGVTVDNPPDPRISYHGTHTSGIIASQHGTWRGIGPGVERLIGAGWSGAPDWHESLAYAVGLPSPRGEGAVEPAQVVSASQATGLVNDETGVVRDAVMHEVGVSYTAGAGNAGPTGGSVGNGYNNGLVVAAFDDAGTPETSDDTVADFSSRGPTPGGRKKPDLIAPGVNITASGPPAVCMSFPSDPVCTPASALGYNPVSGTSFSTPMVGGALALLHGAGVSDPRTARAILVNSAGAWQGHAQWRRDAGWGTLDVSKALTERGNSLTGSVESNGARFYRATVSTGGKATLAWDRRGILFSWPTPLGVVVFGRTNLDLHQYRGNDLSEVLPPPDPGHGAGPDALSDNDTTEQVRAPEAGEMIYKVKAASPIAECLVEHPPCEGDEEEPFALAAAAPLTELVPPSVRPVEVEVTPQGTVACLQGPGDVVVTARARNDSPHLDAHDAELDLGLPAGVELVEGSAAQQIGSGLLASDETSDALTWIVRASTSGVKLLEIEGSGGTMGETFTAAAEVSFEANCTPPAVMPIGLALGPAGDVACGTPVTVTARLHNPSALDAGDSRVALDLPVGVALLDGAASQVVSGGTLAAGGTSVEHVWVVRQDVPGDVAAAIVGAGVTVGQPHQDTRHVALGCTASGPPDSPDPGTGPSLELLPSRIDAAPLRVRRGRIVARGRVVGEGRLRGGVRIRARLRRGAGRGIVRRQVRRRLNATGRFRARIRVCRAGRWRLRVRYLGTAQHRTAAIGLGAIRTRKPGLRC